MSPDDRREHGRVGGKVQKVEKDIAYLKNNDAYDYRDNGMISILLDFVLDEVHKKITMKFRHNGAKRTRPSYSDAQSRENH